MNFKELVERHPEVLEDRRRLSFASDSEPDVIAAAFSRCGVVMLRRALPAAVLEASGEAFRRFSGVGRHNAEKPEGETYQGSWHSPWIVRDGERFPAAAVLSAVLRSWIWDVVEELCGSSRLVVLLKWCTARHNIDRPLGVGGHQDAKVVAADVPFSLWIPFNPIVPGRASGLGFVVPSPDGFLPTLANDDIGADYVLADPARLWIPSYSVGDLTIHSRFSPHFTTGYGTQSDRFSLEIRVMARAVAPEKYLDPAVYVSRRAGLPTIIETRPSSDGAAGEFLACADLADVVAKELRQVVG
jgi:hypothetical protein